MRENRVRGIWKTGGAVVNGWLHIPSSWPAEILAHQGFDSLTLDMEHGFADIGTALTIFQAISTTTVTPLARAPWNEPGIMMRLLDAGCMGIICPMINTREEAENFVGACRYHPQGYRSLGPTRARLYAGADYASHANDSVITMAMIETAEALDNLDAICSTPGLDGIYVGPGDLGLSLNREQRTDYTDPFLLGKLDLIAASTRKHNIVAGIHTNSPDFARKMIDKGYQFVTVMADSTMLATFARQLVEATREGLAIETELPTSPY